MPDWPVRDAKQKELEERMLKLGIRPDDLIEKFIHGSGPGGQKINKTASQVYLKHIPTGIEIKVQRSRSRELNRFLARRELCDRLEEKLLGAESKTQKAIFKIRKQKARRNRKSKEKMLEAKHRIAEKKLLRSSPTPDD
jgi:peptide chain release factor